MRHLRGSGTVPSCGLCWASWWQLLSWWPWPPVLAHLAKRTDGTRLLPPAWVGPGHPWTNSRLKCSNNAVPRIVLAGTSIAWRRWDISCTPESMTRRRRATSRSNSETSSSGRYRIWVNWKSTISSGFLLFARCEATRGDDQPFSPISPIPDENARDAKPRRLAPRRSLRHDSLSVFQAEPMSGYGRLYGRRIRGWLSPSAVRFGQGSMQSQLGR